MSMKELSVSVNGVPIVVRVDEDMYEELSSNPSRLGEVLSTELGGTSPESALNTSQGNTTGNSNEQFRWTDANVRLLLTIRLAREEDFNRPRCTKKKLWDSIAQEISTITGKFINGDACDSKYRNLLTTYRANKKKQKQSGESSITWEYFYIFDEALGRKASTEPPVQTVGCSLDYDPGEGPSNQDEIETPPRKKARKETWSLNNYLKEKLELERQKWEEKKTLKVMEIEAILKLAEAMANRQ